MINHFVNYYKGYLKVRLISDAPERFFNMCSNHDIFIWNLRNYKEAYEFYLYRRDFLQLKSILKKSHSQIVILEKKGLPMFLFKNRKRKAFFAGVVFAFTFLAVMSLFIWDIQINGNVSETDDVILDYLKQESVSHGILKSKINCSKMEEKLRAQFNDIIWASVQIKGTRLIISVQEGNARETTVEKKDDTPKDIVASKSGIITSIITRRGVPQVTQGTQVKKGDILVLGRIEILNDAGEVSSYQYCQSDADIMVRTAYSYRNEFSLIYEEKEYTGGRKSTYSIRAFDYLLSLNPKKKPYKDYDYTSLKKQLKLSKNFYLPFFFETNLYQEYQVVKKQYSEEEATQISKSNLNQFCQKLIEKGVQIVENNVIIEVNGKSCIGSGSITVIEPIGKYKKTKILDVPTPDTEEGNTE